MKKNDMTEEEKVSKKKTILRSRSMIYNTSTLEKTFGISINDDGAYINIVKNGHTVASVRIEHGDSAVSCCGSMIASDFYFSPHKGLGYLESAFILTQVIHREMRETSRPLCTGVVTSAEHQAVWYLQKAGWDIGPGVEALKYNYIEYKNTYILDILYPISLTLRGNTKYEETYNEDTIYKIETEPEDDYDDDY